MSAGYDVAHGLTVVSSLDGLAPRFRVRLQGALADCHADGYDAIVYETLRSEELQALYYARGRPPTDEYPEPVTNAADVWHSWHAFGLAADVISELERWNVQPLWRDRVTEIMKAHGLDSGLDWEHPDPPHVQLHGLKKSPSDLSRQAYATGGLEAVWRLCEAI